MELKDCVTFIPKIEKGVVVKVYDGDTITIATQLPNDETWYKFSIRLFGIDTPEIKDKPYGNIAKDELYKFIFNKEVTLSDVCYEKYGRILANVYLGDINISDWMVENKLAVKYLGGTKQIVNWSEYNPQKYVQ